jgi:hypothetical protein
MQLERRIGVVQAGCHQTQEIDPTAPTGETVSQQADAPER